MCWIVVELFNKTDGIFEDLSPVRKTNAKIYSQDNIKCSPREVHRRDDI